MSIASIRRRAADVDLRRHWTVGPTFVGIAILATYLILTPLPPTSDADNFWMVDLADLYHEPWGGPDAYVYSPAFAQLIAPFTVLPFDLFYKLVQAINLAILGWLLTPALAAAALLLPFVQEELRTGQIHLVLALMCVVGIRHPTAWAFGLLTKVTPGVALLWFAARAEWRSLVRAIGFTLLLVFVSAIFMPAAWGQWLGLLRESSTLTVTNFTLNEWPVAFRLPIAAGLIVMAAWRDRPAAIPPIVLLALPALWLGSPVLLLAIPRLAGWRLPR